MGHALSRIAVTIVVVVLVAGLVVSLLLRPLLLLGEATKLGRMPCCQPAPAGGTQLVTALLRCCHPDTGRGDPLLYLLLHVAGRLGHGSSVLSVAAETRDAVPVPIGGRTGDGVADSVRDGVGTGWDGVEVRRISAGEALRDSVP